MKFLVTIDRDEDGVWVVECPSIPGCVSQGKTEEEAEGNIREAIKQCLEVRAAKNLPLTVTTRHLSPRNFRKAARHFSAVSISG